MNSNPEPVHSPAEPAGAPNDQINDNARDPSVAMTLIGTHLTWLIICTVVVFASLVMTSSGEDSVYLPFVRQPLPGVCYSREWLGINCPGCGLTRCFIHMAHGDVWRAMHFNPVGPFLFVAVVLQIPWRLLQIVRIRRGLGELWPGRMNWLIWVLVGGLVVQWAVRATIDFFS